MEVKPIFNGYLAKFLLNNGNNIIDIQKNKNIKNATVFYFEDNEKLCNDILAFLNNRHLKIQ